MIGLDPRPFSLRELLWMAEGAQRERWSRASVLLALLANCNRDPRRTRPFKPEDFDPYAAPTRQAPVTLTKTTIGQLRTAMTH